jgi:GTP-binding protein
MKVNICKAKQLTNMRAAGKDDNTGLTPPKVMTLEEAVEYVLDNEFVEVTPEAIRMGQRPKAKRF